MLYIPDGFDEQLISIITAKCPKEFKSVDEDFNNL